MLDRAGQANQAGDVYSFGIILQEIITRSEPYGERDMEPSGNVLHVLWLYWNSRGVYKSDGPLILWSYAASVFLKSQ